jgi:hypothetical protein
MSLSVADSAALHVLALELSLQTLKIEPLSATWPLFIAVMFVTDMGRVSDTVRL